MTSLTDLPRRLHAESGAREVATIFDRALRLAGREPDAVALIDNEKVCKVGEIVSKAEALAASLAGLGVQPGDVVSFQTPNWHEAAVIDLAAAAGGFVINPIVPIYRDAEVGFMLRDSRAKVFFFAERFRGYDYAAMVERIRHDLPDLVAAVPVRTQRRETCDLAALVDQGSGHGSALPNMDASKPKLLLYTSGTTGRPKGVLHSHDTIAHAMHVSSSWWGVRHGDAMLMPSPVTHISGYTNGLELPFLAGTRSVLMECWNAQEALALIERHAIVGTVAATPFLSELAMRADAAGTTLPTLRFFACGGAAVPPETIRHANETFGRSVAFRAYGSSEAPLVSAGIRSDDHAELAATTDGRISDYDVKVVGNDGRSLPAGEEGELLVRGPSLFIGYADPADNADAFDIDGYFRTGDLGFVSPEGFVTISGRKKDLIIRGGENISAKEIEDVLHRHPAIAEAAVIAMPHERFGEGICAVLVPRGEACPDLANIVRFVDDQGLARQKCPERIVWARALPLTQSGKVRKDVLRAMARLEGGFGEIMV